MSGFSFPPPPPPPPKTGQSASAFTGPPSQSSNRGRSRGRGSQRERGDFAPQSSGRPSYHTTNRQQAGHQNGAGTNDRGGFANVQPQHWRTTQFQPQSHNLPAGTFLNPNFVPNQSLPGQNGVSPTSFSTEQKSNAQVDPRNQHGSPARTFAGHKRKLEALRGPAQEKKPLPLTAPSIPSFGFSFVPSATASLPKQSLPATEPQSKPKGKTNVLGLTPANWDAQYSSSESDNDGDDAGVDEEALHAELGDKLTFEHNGIVMTLSSPADLAAWKKERSKNWPTRARMAEKDIERRKVGEERKRLLAEARVLLFSSQRRPAKQKIRMFNTPMNQQLMQDAFQTDALDKSTTGRHTEPMLGEVMMEIDESSSHLGDPNSEYVHSEANKRQEATTSDLPDTSSAPVESSIQVKAEPEEASDVSPMNVEAQLSQSDDSTSGDSSSDISSDSSDDDSDDGPPEEVTSKPAGPPMKGPQMRACRYFAASGYCRDGDAGRFKHERAEGSVPGAQEITNQTPQPMRPKAPAARLGPEQRTGKPSLYQRLVEQQQEHEDRLALKVIKYLGKAGFFKPSATSS